MHVVLKEFLSKPFPHTDVPLQTQGQCATATKKSATQKTYKGYFILLDAILYYTILLCYILYYQAASSRPM